MGCLKPILAFDFGVREDGKRNIRIARPFEIHNLEEARQPYRKIMMLPCGHCTECAKDYARMWQLRIMCEAQYHDKNCFVTLTYKKETKPNKDDARTFIKALRNKYGNGLKFFLCGELGSITHRFHLHAILFGVDFAEDREVISRRGEHLVYSSKTLDNLWSRGFTSLGELSIKDAGYVSKYCDKKKITGQNDGEFVIMSRGLGRKYYEDHKKELFDSDYIYIEGNKFKIPRYFLKLADADGFYMSVFADDLRQRRYKVAESFRYDRNRSVECEEEGIIAASKIALAHFEQEGSYRDVL